MRARFCWLTPVLIGLLASGCSGSGKLQTKGRLLKNGEPLRVAEDEIVRVMFVPIPEKGQRVTDFHMALFDPADGTFRASGKDGQGVPPGKYRITVEYLKQRRDLLKGAFNEERSPFVYEVNSQTGELTLDLAKPL
jgi:hypothetical protein